MDMDRIDTEDFPMVTYWAGRPITELTRDELLDAFDELAKLYQQTCDRFEQYRKMVKLFDSVRR